MIRVKVKLCDLWISILQEKNAQPTVYHSNGGSLCSVRLLLIITLILV